MSGAAAPALALRDVVHRFGDVTALSEARLTVAPRSIHAVLGENGAGKTTLMKIAFGLLRPAGGEIRVDGVSRVFASPAAAIAAGIGMVQQHPTNVESMTVWENVLLGGSGSLDPGRAAGEVRALIESIGFQVDPYALVGDLPVAAQQRLEILKAVYRKARLLILDEPTAILAPDEARQLYAWLRSFADGGGSVVVVTHKLEEARRFTDQLTVLRAGRTVLEADARDVSNERLTDAMIGESLPTHGSVDRTRPLGEVVARADRMDLLDARRVLVVRNASFDVRAGEVIGIAGVEGSGHHHLLLALAGRHSIHGGRLELPTRVSIVPEDRHRDAVVLPFSLTENAAIRGAGEKRGAMNWPAVGARVAEYLRAYDVRGPGPGARMRELSGGNQQRFILARELDDHPRLVVAENPTRGLDVRAAAFVHGRLLAAADAGAAVVVYSSDLDEILQLADRILVVYAGTVTSVPRDRAQIGAAMLGVS